MKIRDRTEQLGTTDDRVDRLHLTASGRQLAVETPGVLSTFLAVADDLTARRPYDHNTYELIGYGSHARVYALPGSEEMCLKVAAPWTMSDERFLPLPVNLVAEARLMHAVCNYLRRRPAERVFAPDQFAVAKFGGGAAMLQERVAKNFVEAAELRDQPDIFATAKARVEQALEGSGLRFGVTDLNREKNIMLDPAKPAEESDIYVVDLVGPHRRHALRANLAALLSSKKPTAP